ncbi:Protein translocase subunit YajC [hydrothermal vent metagenome]|uniref:Protein translocase subunit YajC n=1 Tax=hydrothermal vent metagenome TaxID=652676 RepID=A0A3B0Y8K4_9ZZZZ
MTKIVTGLMAMMFAGNVFAAEAAKQPSILASLFLPIMLIVVFYFLLIRPQSKRAKEHRALVAALGNGDEVVTSSGILGKIIEMRDDFVELEISDNVRVKIQRTSIGTVLPKGTIKSI